MANTKEYKIVINGISESINAIDSLNKKLENLEQRINTINSTKVSSSAGVHLVLPIHQHCLKKRN